MVERRKALVSLTLPVCLFLSFPLRSAESQASIAEKARAILETNCVSCHGETPMAGLDLRQREAALKGGGRGPALVPGDAQASLLYKAVAQTGDLKMPMGKPRLSPDDLETLRKWINEGALWVGTAEQQAAPTWWSFKKPQPPAVPEVKDADWVKNPVDAFILQKLEEKGLQPAPAADKRTLIRRAYFDLLGLPPTPDDVKRFLEDNFPQAWAHLVDALLASPHYGERWGSTGWTPCVTRTAPAMKPTSIIKTPGATATTLSSPLTKTSLMTASCRSKWRATNSGLTILPSTAPS